MIWCLYLKGCCVDYYTVHCCDTCQTLKENFWCNPPSPNPQTQKLYIWKHEACFKGHTNEFTVNQTAYNELFTSCLISFSHGMVQEADWGLPLTKCIPSGSFHILEAFLHVFVFSSITLGAGKLPSSSWRVTRPPRGQPNPPPHTHTAPQLDLLTSNTGHLAPQEAMQTKALLSLP